MTLSDCPPPNVWEHFLKATVATRDTFAASLLACLLLALAWGASKLQFFRLQSPSIWHQRCQVNLQKRRWELLSWRCSMTRICTEGSHWREKWRIWRIFPWIWGSIGRVLGMSNCVCESIANRNLKHAMSADTCWSVCKPSQSAERHSDAFYSLQLWAFIFVEF